MSIVLDGTKGVSASGGLYAANTFTGTYTGGVVVDYTSGRGRISVGSGDGLTIYNNGVANNALVTLDNSGNLGIGTNSPSDKVQIVGRLSSTYDSSYLSTSMYGFAFKNATNTNKQLWGGYDSSIGAFIQSTNVGVAHTDLIINPNGGKVLIGTTTSYSSAVSVTVGDGTGGAGIYGISNGTGVIYGGHNITSATTPFYFGHVSTTAGAQVRCGNSGGVTLSANSSSWSAISDERVKDIIEPIENALIKINTLRSVIGKYKTDEQGIRRPFLIAQDVQKILPEAIDTSIDNEGTLGLRYSDVIPLLVSSIKELSVRLEDSESKNTELENRIAALENK